MLMSTSARVFLSWLWQYFEQEEEREEDTAQTGQRYG